MYSAFITGHTYYETKKSKAPDAVNYKACAKDFGTYMALQNEELARLRANKKLSWYIS